MNFSIGLLLLLGFLLRLPGLSAPIIDLDESVFAVCGEVVRQGGKLYVDCIDHQPPLVYWFFAGIFKLFGPYNMIAVHLITTLVVFLTALGLRKIAQEFYGKSAGFWTALAYIIFSTTHIPKIISTNIEILANLPLVAAWLLMFTLPPEPCSPEARGQPSRCNDLPESVMEHPQGRRRGLAFWGGTLMAIAFLLKYQVALILIFWIIALLRRPKDFLWSGLGAAIFIGLVLVTFYFQGNLFAFYDETFARGLEYARLGGVTIAFWKTLTIRLGTTIGLMVPLWVFAAKGLSRLKQEGRGMVVLWLVGGLLAASLGGRFYPHYFLLMLPSLCLLAGPALASFWEKISTHKKRAWGSCLALWTLVFLLPRLNFQKTYTWFYQNYARLDSGVEPMLYEKSYREVGDYIRTHSRADEKVVVWGFATPIYFFAKRLPASSSVWSDDLTGRVPGAPRAWEPDFDTAAFIRPGAWEKFMGEMNKNQPRWFVDTAPANLTYYGKYPVQHYPLLSALIHEHYERVATIDQVALYRRR